ncbi:hypothetical protein B0H19DRAFT_1142153 [Mycena capillaripes]|nr:hypothetical protein B0H19DRAFT_1142153 [Mycena capillaripes]
MCWQTVGVAEILTLPLTLIRSPLLAYFLSILVDGALTSCITTSSVSPVTVISSAFIRSRLPLNRSHSFALTINGGPHRSFTTVLPCFISPHLAVWA